jgi:hypothetical protein
MIKTTAESLRRYAAILSIATAASVLLVGRPAFAGGTVTGAPTMVDYWDGNGGTLQIKIGGVLYAAQNLNQACSANESLDTIKNWHSLAQAALLAGKQLTINYNDCGGVHYAYEMAILQ